MNFRSWLFLVPLLLSVPVFGTAADLSTAAKKSAPSVGTISPKEAAAQVEQGKAILLDVREHDETTLGMAAPAKEMPFSEAQRDTAKWQAFVQSLPKDKEIIVYSRPDRRSEIVGEKLVAKGFRVKNMGGFQSWADAGLPTKKP